MATFTVRSKAGPDGVVHFDIPSGFPDSEVEVTLVVQPVSPPPMERSDHGWSPDFLERVLGGWHGEPLERGPQGEYEDRDKL